MSDEITRDLRDPPFRWRWDACVSASCARLWRRSAAEPPLRTCPACGSGILRPAPEAPIDTLRERVARRVFIDGDGEAV